MMLIRPIEQKDNKAIAKVIRESLEEHNVALPGTVYTDPTTDDLFGLFKTPKSYYWVVEIEGEVVGGAGIFPTMGLPSGYIELVKLYVNNRCRGKGIGQRLIQLCCDNAFKEEYDHVYLETLPELDRAVSLYERMGFEILTNPLGNSGHFACSIWAVKKISQAK
jgi:putative acetyltransferase